MAKAKIQGKLRGLDFNPKRLFSKPEDVRTLDLGIVVGVASAVSSYTMDDGSISNGFLGAFEYRDFDTTIQPKASGRCFLHESVTEIIKPVVEDALEEQKKGGPRAAVRFALKVSAVRDNNPQGYTWQYEPLVDIGTADPLAEIKAMLPDAYQAPQIEDKSGVAAESGAIPPGTGTIDGEAKEAAPTRAKRA